MHAAIKLARVNDKFQDPLYLFLELVRAGVMHGHLWSGRAFSGGPSFGTGKPVILLALMTGGLFAPTQTDDEKSCMLLVMRVLSIVPLNFKVRDFEVISEWQRQFTEPNSDSRSHGPRHYHANSSFSILSFDRSHAHCVLSSKWRR